MLKLKNTPRLIQDDFVMTSPQQEQVGQHRNPHGVDALLLITTDLLLAQSQSRFEFLIHQLSHPVHLVNSHHLSRCRLQQIGHQNVGMCRVNVTAFFAQNHGKIIDTARSQARVVNPKGFASEIERLHEDQPSQHEAISTHAKLNLYLFLGKASIGNAYDHAWRQRM